MKALKLLKLDIWKAKFYLVCELPARWKSSQTQSSFDKSEGFWTLCNFTCPLGETYSNSFFDKSKSLNNQEAEKMKLICSNHIFEPKLSNHVLQIDVDLIEKLIPCSWQGGPFEARLARLNFHKKYFLKQNSDAPSGARLAARYYINLVL